MAEHPDAAYRSLPKAWVWAVFIGAAAVLAVDPLVPKYGSFAIEHVWGFYGLLSVVGCTALLLVALVIRRIVRQPEDYWDRIEGPAAGEAGDA